MSPIKLCFASLFLALIPLTSSAQVQPKDITVSEELFWAAHLGYLPIVIDMLERGANVNYLNQDRVTPMHAAASRGHLNLVRYFKDQRAYLHPKTVQNWTPLHHAVRFGHQNVVIYLLNNGAELDAKTSTGQTVFDFARGNAGMLTLLRRYQR